MNRALVVVGLVLLAVVLGGYVAFRPKEKSMRTEVKGAAFEIGRKAPDFTLKDFDGNDVSLSSFYGKKAVVLDFWAAWCPFCVEEMPQLENVQKAYPDKLVMIGVHRTDSGESIATGKKFADERGVTYLLLQGTSKIYNASTSGVKGMPVAVYIDRNGIVQNVKVGPKTESEIKEKVDRLLQ